MSATTPQNTKKPNENTEDAEGNLRYAAYANRFRTILRASHRYIAYTSDVGESFRPVAHPYLITLGYGISWAYLLGDVGYTSWVVKMKNEGKYRPGLMPWGDVPAEGDKVEAEKYQLSVGNSLAETNWKVQFAKRGIFQAVASMGLPAFTIHSAVRYSSVAFKNVKSAPIRNYGPVAIGLGIVPFLPYVFDEPVEHAVDYIFDKGEQWAKRLE